MLAVSCAVAKAARPKMPAAAVSRYFGGAGPMSLPVPMMNVINGGAWPTTRSICREFMILPVGAQKFPKRLRWGAEVSYAQKPIDSKGRRRGDEGGFA